MMWVDVPAGTMMTLMPSSGSTDMITMTTPHRVGDGKPNTANSTAPKVPSMMPMNRVPSTVASSVLAARCSSSREWARSSGSRRYIYWISFSPSTSR